MNPVPGLKKHNNDDVGFLERVGLGTLVALVRFLIVVSLHVDLQVPGVGEPAAAQRAEVRSLCLLLWFRVLRVRVTDMLLKVAQNKKHLASYKTIPS